MFGGKLRSWMEAVRPKKKQHRKDKHNSQASKLQQQQLHQQQQQQHQHQLLHHVVYQYAGDVGGSQEVDDTGRHHHHQHHHPLGMKAVSTSASSELEMLDRYRSQSTCSKSTETVATAATVATTGTSASAELSGSDRPHSGGYASGANLSSPESAYSTGYSTDCTSPGTALPDYYIRSNPHTNGQIQLAGYPSKNGNGVTTVVYSSVLKNGHPATTPLPTHPERVGPIPALSPKSRHPPILVHINRALSTHVERSSSGSTIPAAGHHQIKQPQHCRNKSITHEYDVVDTTRRYSIVQSQCSALASASSAAIPGTALPAPTASGGVNNIPVSSGGTSASNTSATASAVTSPRQRNRIRTNPWLGAPTPVPPCSPGGTSHVVCSPGAYVATGKSVVLDSPFTSRHNSNPTAQCYSPVARLAGINRNSGGVAIESLSSSSSCSSLSVNSLQWDAASLIGSSSRSCGTRRRNKAIQHTAKTIAKQHPTKHSIPSDDDEEEEDCTLNEMMGKYDESYVYEKETDILSDSDPTDCDEEDGDDDETDLDTGQDGGDELDFIDNGSYLEFNVQDQQRINTQHCTYYNFETQRKMSCSKKRNSSRRGKGEQQTVMSGSRRSVKKRSTTEQVQYGHVMERNIRSAGTTPLSVRKVKKSAAIVAASTVIVHGSTGNEQYYRKRSSSVSAAARVPLSAFDQRDKEADRKYRELIVEAEHILMNMKTPNVNGHSVNGILSPVRRLPGPANKRVELLRTECAKQETYHLKSRPSDEQIMLSATNNAVVVSTNAAVANALIPSKIPVRFGTSGCSPRFSPKRNHITNFMNNNSPILLNSAADRSADRSYIIESTQGPRNSPLALRKEQHATLSPMPPRRKGPSSPLRRSPKYMRKLPSPKAKRRVTYNKSDSTDSEPENESFPRKCFISKDEYSNCPQSEPVKRKVYINASHSGNGKAVGFNLQYDIIDNSESHVKPNSSCENLRQEALVHTITNLKRSLLHQSTSLKQVYRSSHTLQS